MTKNTPPKPHFFTPLPQPGDIVLCCFPPPIGAGKDRPALVIAVNTAARAVKVAYGTSQKLHKIYPTEFLIDDAEADFSNSGLRRATKFDLSETVTLEYSDEWFVTPANSVSPSPKLGQLPISSYPGFIKARNIVLKKTT